MTHMEEHFRWFFLGAILPVPSSWGPHSPDDQTFAVEDSSESLCFAACDECCSFLLWWKGACQASAIACHSRAIITIAHDASLWLNLIAALISPCSVCTWLKLSWWWLPFKDCVDFHYSALRTSSRRWRSCAIPSWTTATMNRWHGIQPSNSSWPGNLTSNGPLTSTYRTRWVGCHPIVPDLQIDLLSFSWCIIPAKPV